MAFGAVAGAVVGGVIASSASRSASSAASDASAHATESQERMANKRLDFDQKVYDDGAPDRQFASSMARKTATWQSEDRDKYNKLQDEQTARGRKFQGAEDRVLTDAEAFDTEGKRAELASKAMADVQQGFATAKGQRVRDQQRMGVNPNSGRADALESQGETSLATGLAFAGTKARSDATTMGYARKMDAIGLGKGLVGNQATQAGLSLNTGNASVQNSLVPNAVNQQAGQTLSQGYGNAGTAFSNLGMTQAGNFYASQNYGAGVGNSVGNTFGTLLSKPGVTSGLKGLGDGWSNPYTVDYGGSGIGSASDGAGGTFRPSSNYGE